MPRWFVQRHNRRGETANPFYNRPGLIGLTIFVSTLEARDICGYNSTIEY
jgi:hypothetical protein